jgi:hypothetical protein
MHVYLHDPSNKRRLAASVDESYTLRGFYSRFPERDAVITVAQQFGPIPGARDELLVLEAYLWPGAAGVGRVVSRWRRDGYRNAWDELRRQVTTSTGLDIGAPERRNPTADPRPFIAGAEWTFASTMPDNPHHYVVERDYGGPAFDDFVALIQAGSVRRYRGHDYRAVTVDDFDYWLMRSNDAGWIINRKPSAEAGWDEE